MKKLHDIHVQKTKPGTQSMETATEAPEYPIETKTTETPEYPTDLTNSSVTYPVETNSPHAKTTMQS